DPHVLPTALHAKVVQELDELHAISSYIDSRLENIEQFLNDFVNPPNEIDMDDLEPDDESVDTPLVSPFLDSDDDSDYGEVFTELEEYGNAGKLCRKKVINNIDGDDLAFTCMIGFRNFVVYFDPFLPMNIIMCKAYNTIMEVVMGKPFRNATLIEYDCVKGLVSFTRILDNYTFQMPRTIPRFKIWGYTSWSKITPIHVLSKMDLMNGFKHS
ncbi:hypothetical protein Tco_1564943, partial [Tanacetum coccineum]